MFVKNLNTESQNRCSSEIVIESQIERLLDGFTDDVIRVLISKQTPPINR